MVIDKIYYFFYWVCNLVHQAPFVPEPLDSIAIGSINKALPVCN